MEILFGALAYIVVTFPLAVLWHMKVFRTKYMAWQYFGEDVQPLLGLSSMIIQGVLLAYGYSLLTVNHSSVLVGVEYSLFMGVFLWSVHVLAAMGKSSKVRHFEFLTMETVYLAIQFGVFGILISYVFAWI